MKQRNGAHAQLSFHVMAAIFCQESVVRGHHVYTRVFGHLLWAKFSTRRERLENYSHDRHAVAVVRDSCVVGHLPRQYSRVAWYFLQHGGSGVAKLGHTGARALATRGCAPPSAGAPEK